MCSPLLRRRIAHFFEERDDREWLLRRLPQHAVCAEIGVYQGRFTELILRIARPRKLHLIDPWKFETDPVYERSLYGGPEGKSQAHMDAMYESVAKCFRSKSVEIHREISSACSARFPDDYLDWIYIDGNHQYDFVKQDLERYFSKVKKGGYVVGDDYDRDPGNWTRDGVTRAVDEVVSSGLYEKIVIAKHQFFLRRPAVTMSASE